MRESQFSQQQNGKYFYELPKIGLKFVALIFFPPLGDYTVYLQPWSLTPELNLEGTLQSEDVRGERSEMIQSRQTNYKDPETWPLNPDPRPMWKWSAKTGRMGPQLVLARDTLPSISLTTCCCCLTPGYSACRSLWRRGAAVTWSSIPGMLRMSDSGGNRSSEGHLLSTCHFSQNAHENI